VELKGRRGGSYGEGERRLEGPAVYRRNWGVDNSICRCLYVNLRDDF
jgi:hypothetical protein